MPSHLESVTDSNPEALYNSLLSFQSVSFVLLQALISFLVLKANEHFAYIRKKSDLTCHGGTYL